MKTTKELLEIILNHIDLMSSNEGLCGLIGALFIRKYIYMIEYDELRKYVGLNRPFSYRTPYGAYYWKPGEKKPRIKWLEKHIKKLSKNE